MLEGRYQQPAEQGQCPVCPVCFAQFPGSLLDEHCRTHFNSPERAGANGLTGDEQEILCPLGCGQKIRLGDLASHEMLHRLQQEEDTKLSQEEQRQFEGLQAKFGMTDKRPAPCRGCGQEGHLLQHCPKISSSSSSARVRGRAFEPTAAAIIAGQRPASFHRTQPGLITLLKQAQLAQSGDFRAVLSGHVDHYQATNSDSGWGCGWRNIQMLSSHLVQRDEALRGALFGGCGFVPDIAALQAWLEAAWAAGYDAAGAEQLGNAVQGTHKWVGTTEAATLLRLFGVRAFVVDFRGGQSNAKRRKGGSDKDKDKNKDGEGDEEGGDQDKKSEGNREQEKEQERATGKRNPEEMEGKRNPEQEGEGAPPDEGLVWGGHMKSGSTPGCTDNSGRDVVHEGVQCDACSAFPIRGVRFKSQVMEDYDLCSRCRKKPEAEAYAPFTEMRTAVPKGATITDEMDHSVLVNWVWQYFTGEGKPKKDGTTAAGVTAGNMAAAKLSGGEAISPDTALGPRQLPHPASSSSSSSPEEEPLVDDRSGPVMLSHKPPLYFQHEGHSRTIVGVEWLHNPRANSGPSVHLLVLDPSQGTSSLEKALRTKEGWQRLVKRSTATLQKPEYQLLFCEDGLASSKEQEKLKVMATYQNFGF